MPAVKLSPLFNDQTLTATGAPASGYKLWTYAAGSSAQLASYTDSSGSTPQTNPIILNSLGRPTNGPIWLQSGLSYKFVLQDASGVQVGSPFDNVTGVNDSSSSTSQWLSSGVTPTYVSASSFTLPGDQTTEFHVGRRLQFTVTAGTVYGRVLTSAYTSLTTVTLLMDSGQALDSGLSAANLSILRADNPALSPTLLNAQVFSTVGTATYTPTKGTNSVIVEVQGGGGGGGGSAATGAGQLSAGTGGTSGTFARSRITSGFAGVTVTVGAGGNGGVGNSSGSTGGTSSFGALVSAPGGAGGLTTGAVAPPAVSLVPNSGAVATGGNITNQTGFAGSFAVLASISSAFSGNGGASVFGGGPQGTNAGAGVNATSRGAGGSGALSAQSSAANNGGNGAPGLVIVYEYA